MHNYREFSQPLSAYPLKISRYAPLTQNLSHIRSFMISSHHNCVYKLSLNANSLLGEWESVHYLNYFRKLHCSMVSTKGFFFQDSYILLLSKRCMKVLGRYWIISKPKLLYVLHRLWIIWNFIFWSQETTYIMEVQLWRRSVVLQFKDEHFLYFTLFKCHHQHHKTVISKYACCTTATLFLKSWLNNTTFRILLELTLTLIILYMWLVVELAIKIDKSMYTWLCLCIVLDNAKSRCERIKENYAITMMSGY